MEFEFLLLLIVVDALKYLISSSFYQRATRSHLYLVGKSNSRFPLHHAFYTLAQKLFALISVIVVTGSPLHSTAKLLNTRV